MPILKGRLVLGPDASPRVITLMNNLVHSSGITFYSDISLLPAESGNATDHPNRTDINATISVPGSGCASPTIQSLSGGGDVAPSQTATFAVDATGAEFYEWLRNGVTLTETGRIAGTGTATLTISDPSLDDAGSYRARVYNACGTPKLSDPVVLTIVCGGDFNRDGLVEDTDFVEFAHAYSALLCPPAPASCHADLNRDAFVDDGDFVIFATQYDQLLCP